MILRDTMLYARIFKRMLCHLLSARPSLHLPALSPAAPQVCSESAAAPISCRHTGGWRDDGRERRRRGKNGEYQYNERERSLRCRVLQCVETILKARLCLCTCNVIRSITYNDG